ncbi:hypothetical protein I7I48_08329 [Histoplasma ohiense]|nr:hypothetical protein I7I48_08329 [Histoplasma ohiense (nom. inval.)]
MSYMQFEPNTQLPWTGPTKPNQTKPARPALQPQILLGCLSPKAAWRARSLFGLWDQGSRTDKSSEQIIHFPLNPKPPKFDATARELNSERFLGSFVVLVGGMVPRGQRGIGGERRGERIPCSCFCSA